MSKVLSAHAVSVNGYISGRTLSGALEVLTGKVTATCMQRKRTSEVLKFMSKVARSYPKSQEIHVILDNISTHKGDTIKAWLEKHPNFTFHYTPTGSSWINQIENWFGIITRQAIRRGSFKSLAMLISRIDDYVTHWNEDAEPFEWMATADSILEKVAILNRDYKKWSPTTSSNEDSITSHLARPVMWPGAVTSGL